MRALLQRPATTAGGFGRATAATAAVVVAVAVLGTFAMRGWGRVPWSTPSVPWYHSFPFYLFLDVHLSRWALPAGAVAAGAVAALVALHRGRARWPVRVAATVALELPLALAVAALREGPRGWTAPLDSTGEYPAGVGQVHGIAAFLGGFPELLASLPSHAAGHPAGAMVVYELVDRVWPGLHGAALGTVAVGCLGAVVAGSLARDELGEEGGRWALTAWALSPVVLLYVATSADAVFAVALGAAVLAAHRGLVRRSARWTLAGGVGLWAASMLTYSSALLLVFLGVRAAGRLRADRAWVLRWAALSAGAVLALAGVCWLATGYDPVAAVRAVAAVYRSSPGSAGRPWLPWVPGDLLAFGGMLGLPLLAALAARAAGVVRERAWTSVDAAAFATLLAAASWGFTRGEVERIWQFLVPLALVAAVRQLLAWRARSEVVAALLAAQAVTVELLFVTRW
jgi:methylthioxylose transferase